MNKLTMGGTILNHHFINLSYLDLMADGDLKMKKLMLEMLLKEIPRELNKMQQLYQQHRNPSLSSANRSIEYAAKREEGLEQLPDFFGILKELSPKILRELRSVYDFCCQNSKLED